MGRHLPLPSRLRLVRDRIAARPGTAAGLAVLSLVALVQQPGRVSFDTKLDLTIDPVAFLGRALHLWNPEATSGELQNQAYGYFFPIGPFFAIGDLVGLPAWLTQGIWAALLLCAAYLGVLLLAGAMKIGRGAGAQLAALGYALAPRMLTEIGPLSAELLPTVLLPWVLLPLVRAERTGSVRRAAGLSALAVLAMGGTNASMVLMALVLPALWLVTRRLDRRQLTLTAAWCAAVLAATAWWIGPLVLLGRFSPPFLDYIESARSTTDPVSLFQALRGTDHWVAHVVQGGRPWWPQGWLLIDNPVLMAATTALAGCGLFGLALRGLPHRRFLVPAAAVGLTLLVIGHAGPLDSPLSGPVRTLLDGPLAVLRNVHKFDPVLRLPLLLGLAHGTALVWRRRRTRYAAPLVAGALLIAVSAPAWLLTLRPDPTWSALPGYWTAAADWLREHQRSGRTMLLPATGFGRYTWGFTVDEPIQALGGVRWSLRSQVPLGSAGNTRLLDTVEQALDSGRGSPALAGLLARSGYRYLLLRNDIDPRYADGAPAAVLRAALTRSPGVTLAATFGPLVTPVVSGDTALDGLTDRTTAALEVFAVAAGDTPVTAVPRADVPTVSGGPESLLPLLEQGLVRPDQPVVLAGDGTGGGPAMVTDGLRRAERDFGRVRDGVSATMTAAEPGRTPRAARDLLPFDDTGHATVAQYDGVTAVDASSAASFADGVGPADPAHLPFAAVDGRATTSWHSSSPTGPVGQWLQVTLARPTRIAQVAVRFVDDLRLGWPVEQVRISTDAGATESRVVPGGGTHTYRVPDGVTRTVRVTVRAMAGGRTDGQVGIVSLSLPQVTPERSLRVPDDQPADRPTSFSFSRTGDRSACLRTGATQRCDSRLARGGEETDGLDRRFVTGTPTAYRLSGTVLLRSAGADPAVPAGVTAGASAVLADDPAAGAGAAVDGNRQTAWLPGPGQLQPTLTLAWSRPRRVDTIRITPAEQPGTSAPRTVELRSGAGIRRVEVPASGAASFAPLTTDRVDVVVTGTRGTGRNADDRAPTGLAELRLGGVPELGERARTFAVPCGEGPDVLLDGVRHRTAVSGRTADLDAGRPVALTFCGGRGRAVTLPAGEHRLRTAASEHFAVRDLVLRAGDGAAATGHRTVTVRRWTAVDRSVRVGPGAEALLVVPENANAGWRAELGGVPLAATRVDGWQQAWVLPAGAGGTVDLRYPPDRAYRTVLVAGALAVLILLLVTLPPVRRPGRHSGRPGPPPAPPATRLSIGPAWLVPAALMGSAALLMTALGGVPALAALVGALILREFWSDGPLALVAAGVGTAGIVAVAGRLGGHGQQWADGPWGQAALLIAVAGLLAAFTGAPPGGRHVRESALE